VLNVLWESGGNESILTFETFWFITAFASNDFLKQIHVLNDINKDVKKGSQSENWIKFE